MLMNEEKFFIYLIPNGNDLSFRGLRNLFHVDLRDTQDRPVFHFRKFLPFYFPLDATPLMKFDFSLWKNNHEASNFSSGKVFPHLPSKMTLLPSPPCVR